MSVAYSYQKSPIDVGRLSQEILDEITITTNLEYCTFDPPDDLVVVFASVLSGPEKTALDTIVSAHGGEAIPFPAELPTLGEIPEGYLIISDGEDSTYWGHDRFTNLADTPTTYSGHVGDYLRATASGLEFVTITSGIVFGTQHYNICDNVIIYTTSTTYIQKTTLPVYNVPAGNYRIGWFYEWSFSSANAELNCRVQVDDIDILTETSTRPTPADITNFRSASGFACLEWTAGNHHVDIDFCSNAGGKTAAMRNSRIEIWRIS